MYRMRDLQLTRSRNTKNQTPSSTEIPSSKSQAPQPYRQIGAWDLELLWCLELGVWCFHCFHSYLSASIGSTFAARRAGSQQAVNATATSRPVTAANVNGSVGCTP